MDEQPIPLKRCKGPCGQEYPATAEYFHSVGRSLRPQCKECRNAARRKPPVVDDIPEGYKRCNGTCKQILPATAEYFYRNKKMKDGLLLQCKECMSKDAKATYQHPEVRARRLAYATNRRNSPEGKAYRQAYSKAYSGRPEVKEHMHNYRHDPKIKEREKARRKVYQSQPEIREHRRIREKEYRNRPEIREHIQAYYKARYSRPEVKERNRIRQANRQALKRSIPGVHTPEQIQDQLKRQKHKCYYCQKRLKKQKGKYIYHIEHTFPISRVAGRGITRITVKSYHRGLLFQFYRDFRCSDTARFFYSAIQR